MNSEEFVVPRSPEKLLIRSQDMEEYYYDAGTFIFLGEDHIKHGLGDEYVPYILPDTRCIDIDDMSDFEMAELLYLGLQQKNMQEGS